MKDGNGRRAAVVGPAAGATASLLVHALMTRFLFRTATPAELVATLVAGAVAGGLFVLVFRDLHDVHGGLVVAGATLWGGAVHLFRRYFLPPFLETASAEGLFPERPLTEQLLFGFVMGATLVIVRVLAGKARLKAQV